MQPVNKRAFRLTGVYLLGVLAERGALFLLLPFITSHLTPSDFGAFSLLVLTGTVLNYFVVSPPTLALQRFFYEPNYERDRGCLLGSLVIILACKALIVASGYWCASGYVSGILFGGQGLAIAVKSYTAVLVLWPMAMMFLLLLQLTERALVCVVVSTLSVCMGSGVSIYCLVYRDCGPEALVYGQIVQHAMVAALTLPFVLKEALWSFRWKIIVEPLRWAYSLLPSAYSDLVIQSADRYLLAVFCGTSTVGLYDLGYRISSVVSLLLGLPVKRGLHPLILQMEREPDAQKRFIRESALWFYVLGLFLAIALAVFSREIIVLVARDSSYWAVWTIVPIAVFAYLQQATGQFLNYGIVMAKKGAIESVILLISAASNVLLNILLIPSLGMIGAALATLASFLLWNGLKVHFSRRLYGLTFDLRRMGHATVVAVSLVGAAMAVELWGGLSLVATSSTKASCVVLFPLVLGLTGFFSRSDFEVTTTFVLACWRKLVGGSARKAAG